jgi:hypothetical protein
LLRKQKGPDNHMATGHTFNPADRVKAGRIRKKLDAGEELPEDEQAWFDTYESAKRGGKRKSVIEVAAEAAATNGSATEKITYTEERAAATGNHPHPAYYEASIRAEGLRADTLLRIAADALVRVTEQYAAMNAHLLARTTAIETAHVAMLDAVREHYISRIEAEGEAEKQRQIAAAAAAAGGEDNELGALIAYVMQAKALKDAQENEPRKGRARKKSAKKSKPLGDST